MTEEQENQLRAILKASFTVKVENALISLIEHLRNVQKNYCETLDEKVSGLDLLSRLLEDGTISLTQYIAILPAIENYSIPYELNLTTKA